jgi:hypothetical protein
VRANRLGLPLIAGVIGAGCGAKTELYPIDGAGADAGADVALDVAVAPDTAPACTWSVVGPAERVSGDPMVPGDVALMDAVPSVGGALIAWRTAGDKMQPQTVILRLISFDPAASGNEHLILRAPDVVHTVEDVSLAVGHGHAGVVGTTGAVCSFHPITVDGASNGGTVVADPRSCAGLTDTASGFDLLVARKYGTRTAEILRTGLDGQGQPSGALASLFTSSGSLGRPARATFDDGSFLALIGRADGTQSARRFDALGVPLGPELVAYADANVVASALAKTATGAVAAFATSRVPGPSQVWTVALDRDGRALQGPLLFASASEPISSLTVATDPNGGALIGWTEAVSSASVAAFDDARPFRPSAALLLAATLPNPSFAPAIRVVAIDRQGFAIFEARTDTAPHRVYAVPLGCTPRFGP